MTDWYAKDDACIDWALIPSSLQIVHLEAPQSFSTRLLSMSSKTWADSSLFCWPKGVRHYSSISLCKLVKEMKSDEYWAFKSKACIWVSGETFSIPNSAIIKSPRASTRLSDWWFFKPSSILAARSSSNLAMAELTWVSWWILKRGPTPDSISRPKASEMLTLPSDGL